MSKTIDLKPVIDNLLTFYLPRLQGFQMYDSLYLGTNESLSHLLPKDFKLTDAPVLTVTASGDVPIEFIRRGVVELDCFDINFFSKYMMELKLASIKALTHEEFISFYTEGNNILDEKLFFEKIVNYLSTDAWKFWSYVYQIARNNNYQIPSGNWIYNTNLFEHLVVPYDNLSKQDSYLEKSMYSKTQSILKNDEIKINYLSKSLAQLSDEDLQQTYQIIYLSNIIEYIPSSEIKSLRIFRQIIDELAMKHLSAEGIIIIAYLCQVGQSSKINIASHDFELQKNYFPNCEFNTFPNLYNEYFNDQTIVYRKRQK